MGQVIAVVSGKGGTGKTTLTALVGAALATLGKRVLLLDCDVGLRDLDLALGMSDRVLMDFSDVAAGRAALDEAAVSHPRLPGLFLLTAPVTLESRLAGSAGLRALFSDAREHYDFCLADGGAGLGEAFRLATGNADRALVVTAAEPAGLRDAQRTVSELWDFPDGSLHLIVNRLRRSMLKSLRSNLDDAMDTAGLPLLGVVPEDDEAAVLLARGMADRLGYFSPARRAAHNIARRLCGERVPLMKL